MEKQPIVSVVMPIYNVEKYLEESLDSVLSQTLKDIEVICVDNASTDCSGKILDRYADMDERVVVIHKPMDTGYGNSMNMGMERASGKYIAIVEPDDWIKETMLEDLYVLAEKYDVDFVRSDYVELYGERPKYQMIPAKVVRNQKLYNRVLDKKEIIYLCDGEVVAHWTGLYKKDFLQKNNIVFHESPGASFQDTGFWFQTLFFAEKIYLTDNSYYCYRRDNLNSGTHSKEKVYCICKEYDFIFERLKDEQGFLEIYLPWFMYRRYTIYISTFRRIADEYKQEFLRYISEELKIWQRNNLFDLSRLSETDRKRVAMVLQDPENFYEKWRNREADLNKLCIGDIPLYIYGAGDFAQKAYKVLTKENRKRLCGFIVTDKHRNPRTFFDIPVYSYEELRDEEERSILIGVSELYINQVKNILLEAGEKHIIELPYEVM